MSVMMTMQVRQFREDNDEIKNPIYVTSQDKQRLEDLLMEVEASDPRKHGDLKALTEELHRAIIVDPKRCTQRRDHDELACGDA